MSEELVLRSLELLDGPSSSSSTSTVKSGKKSKQIKSKPLLSKKKQLKSLLEQYQTTASKDHTKDYLKYVKKTSRIEDINTIISYNDRDRKSLPHQSRRRLISVAESKKKHSPFLPPAKKRQRKSVFSASDFKRWAADFNRTAATAAAAVAPPPTRNSDSSKK